MGMEACTAALVAMDSDVSVAPHQPHVALEEGRDASWPSPSSDDMQPFGDASSGEDRVCPAWLWMFLDRHQDALKE